MVNSEKGITLIELLISTALGSAVIFIASLTFFSMSNSFSTSSLQYSDNTKIRLLMDAYNQLSGAVRIYVIKDSERKELRMELGTNSGKYKSIYYDSSNHTLTIYDFNSSNLDDFTNAAISLANDSDRYVNGFEVVHLNSSNDFLLSDEPKYFDTKGNEIINVLNGEIKSTPFMGTSVQYTPAGTAQPVLTLDKTIKISFTISNSTKVNTYPNENNPMVIKLFNDTN